MRTAPPQTSQAARLTTLWWKIPIFYYKISHNNTHTFVQISSAPLDGFTEKAFRYNGELTDAFYVGAYSGYVDSSNKLRSLSGKTPTGSKTIGAFRTAAHANGDGYEQLNFISSRSCKSFT